MAIRDRIRTLTAQITPSWVMLRIFEALLGCLFSNIIFARGIMPFGIAYAAAGSFSGFLGVFVGHLFSGRDLLRILTSCFMARVFRMTMTSLSEENRPLSYFLFTLWGTMLGGLAGFFFSDYTPMENFAFMFNGLLSGGLSWLFSVAMSAFSSRPLGSIASRYVCCLLALSALLTGLMNYGGIFEAAGQMALLFLLLCVGHKCSFFYTLSTAAVTGIFLCLFSPARIPWLLVYLFGVLLSAALKPFGKYGLVLSYFLAGVGVSLFSQGVLGFWAMAGTVFFAGFLFLTVPLRWMTVLTKATVPVGGGGRWKRARFRFSNKGSTVPDTGGESVCRTCPKRMLCFTKFKAETAAAFDEIRAGVRERDLRPRREFLNRCIRFPEVIAALRRQEETVYGLNYAKAFAQKEGELFCGDTAGGYRTGDDRYVFTVTDGMGSGTKAARQSVKAVRVMENLSRNGLGQEDIFKVLNRNLLDDREEAVLGVDVAAVDLKNGVCDLFKAGAAPTYILRKGIAYELGSETLPVGMLEEVDVKHQRCTLSDRDYLILISDGILGKDKKWLSEYLNRIPPPKDCVSLAEGILNKAKKDGRNRIDDLTVLAVQITKVA